MFCMKIFKVLLGMFDAERQSNGLLLNETAIAIRPGSVKSIFCTKAATILVTKDVRLPLENRKCNQSLLFLTCYMDLS